jgi:tetratricopeptide (TPR) repeat protein
VRPRGEKRLRFPIVRQPNFLLVSDAERSLNGYFMRVRGMAAAAALVVGLAGAKSFAADNVAPTKAELEEMYSAAYRAFDANKYSEALKQLDALDARQADVAASKNLRGVILMRQGKYDEAETALQEAARIDPKFWNARFNLAEIPFMKKDWAEARKRFEQLLSSSETDLAKEASQLIQYKILLTYLPEGKNEMVDSILAKLELSPDTPAVDYAKAAMALQQKKQADAKDWISAAEKNFSPQQNKLFAESFYEIGWVQRPAGEGRASLPLMTAAERSEKTKAAARSKFEQAQQALRQRDYAAALKLVDEADKADPNQPATLNLRGEILMQQQQYDEAEAAFNKAARLDPKFREAQYNLAQVPFKKKEYAKARERFEALYKRTPGGDRNQAAELIKFKIYMTLLLEGKESRAHAMVDEFQFTGDTPALYYAQAAWEYKHNNPEKAADWTSSANKIYSPSLNSVFADSFYDAGWLQRPEGSTAPAVAFDTTNVAATQGEGGPAVEPSPIPDKVAAADKEGERAKEETLSLSAPVKGPDTGGLELASAGASPSGFETPSLSNAASAGETSPQQPESSSAGGQTATAPPMGEAKVAQVSGAPSDQKNQQPMSLTITQEKTGTMPAAPAKVASTGVAPLAHNRMWLVGALVLVAVILLAWAIVPSMRRGYAFNVPGYLRPRPPGSGVPVFKPTVASAQRPKANAPGNGFAGGPPQVSLQLKPWRPSVHHTALPSQRLAGAFDRFKALRRKRAAGYREPQRQVASVAEPVFESSVGPIVEQASEETVQPTLTQATEPETAMAADEFTGAPVFASQQPEKTPEKAVAFSGEQAQQFASAADQAAFSPASSAFPEDAQAAWPEAVTSPAFPVEPMRQEQLDQSISIASLSAAGETAAEPVSDGGILPEPEFSQTTIPVTMQETTQTPSAPVTKAPATPAAKPQPPAAATMQTTVQLTFSFEIAAMQLTPSFKMGVLKVRPISKLVTMRVPAPQRAQSALNLQVAFEVVKIQPAAGALGTIRLVPSQQPRPSGTIGGMPSFAVAGLQVVPNSDTAPVQFTPAPQGRAAVFITVPFQIGTLEFSPSLEIASVIVNSNSKQVIVQLPGAAPGPAEGAPIFEITNLELSESGDIAMMQLNLLGGPKRA